MSLDNLKTILNAIKHLLTDYPKKKDIPTKLPNPNPLTFTGAVTGNYDGSEPLTVEMPSVPKPLTYDYMPEGYPSKSGFDIEWDGNTDGLTSVIYNSSIAFYKVSDIVPTNDELSGGTFSPSDGGEVIPITSDMIITPSEDLRIVAEYIIIVQKENATFGDALFPQTGTYFFKGINTGNYIARLSKQTITPMSEEFIPKMNVSAFTNDAGYLTLADIETVESQLVDIPSKLSQFQNDAGYLTLDTLPKYDGSVITE